MINKLKEQKDHKAGETAIKDTIVSKKEKYESLGIPVDRLVICNGVPLSVVD